jgi:hypothetical protein
MKFALHSSGYRNTDPQTVSTDSFILLNLMAADGYGRMYPSRLRSSLRVLAEPESPREMLKSCDGTWE